MAAIENTIDRAFAADPDQLEPGGETMTPDEILAEARADAQTRADAARVAAESAAAAYAQAQAGLAATNAAAYADGIVDAEEARAIADATAKADAARVAAVNAAAADATAKANLAATTANYDNVAGRPTVYRIVARGGTTSSPVADGFYQDNTFIIGSMRSYNMLVVERSTHNRVFYQTYDVFGIGEATSGRHAEHFRNDLNYFADRPGQYVVVVWSFDEPMSRRFDHGLQNAIYRNGGSRAVYGSPQFKYRAAYVLIGVSGCGEGNGSEGYQGAVDNDPGAWVDMSFTLLKGLITGVSNGYKPKTLQDYSYTGDMNATTGAPAGTNVAGTPAETVAANANAAIKPQAGFNPNITGSGVSTGPVQTFRSVGFSVNPTGWTGSYSVSWAFSRTSGGMPGVTPYLTVDGNSASVNANSTTQAAGSIEGKLEVRIVHSGGIVNIYQNDVSITWGFA